MLRNNSTILFQGDSITDAGRTYDASENLGKGADAQLVNFGLGCGYPLLVRQYLDAFCRDKNITVLNRGVSGDRTAELLKRWDKDCIELKPDYLSILIGVNDTWRRYDSGLPTTTEEYEQNFRLLLSRAKKETGCELIILEPFLLPVDAQKDCWREDLDPKIHVARKLAIEFNAVFIPLDGIFAAACVSRKADTLSSDGVHPTDAGHSLIAKQWLDTVL